MTGWVSVYGTHIQIERERESAYTWAFQSSRFSHGSDPWNVSLNFVECVASLGGCSQSKRKRLKQKKKKARRKTDASFLKKETVFPLYFRLFYSEMAVPVVPIAFFSFFSRRLSGIKKDPKAANYNSFPSLHFIFMSISQLVFSHPWKSLAICCCFMWFAVGFFLSCFLFFTFSLTDDIFSLQLNMTWLVCQTDAY